MDEVMTVEAWAEAAHVRARTEQGGMIGRTYLERGQPVIVLCRSDYRRKSPRNVLIRRQDGSLTVRPFRGLRRNLEGDA
jgi:hypothetical protein